MENQAIIGGPITFVTFLEVQEEQNEHDKSYCLIYAHGPYIFTCPLRTISACDEDNGLHYKYKCSPFATVRSNDVLKGTTVHGVKQSYCTAATNSTNLGTRFWIVFGNRKLSIVSGGITTKWIQHSIRVGPTEKDAAAAPYIVLSDWIWDARFIQLEKQPHNYRAATALANNTVEIWSMTCSARGTNQDIMQFDAQSLFRVGEIKCITYCMSIYGWHHGEENVTNFPVTTTESVDDSSDSHTLCQEDSLLIASGSCFSEIIVWRVLLLPATDAVPTKGLEEGAPINTGSHVVVQLIQRIQGHHGAIFSVKWQHITKQESHEWYLASTSDDRTVRVWKMINNNFQQMRCGFGHTARVWDVVFLNGKLGFTAVASVGEEGITRVWSVSSSDASTFATCDLYTTFRGHYDGLKMCLWKIATITIGNTFYLAVGGNDGCVKLYSMLQPQSIESLSSDADCDIEVGGGISKVVLHVPVSYDPKAIPGNRIMNSTTTGFEDSIIAAFNSKNSRKYKNNNVQNDNKLTNSNLLQNEQCITMTTEADYARQEVDKETPKVTAQGKNGQSLCSAQFYPTDPNCILVSIKTGAWWTYHLPSTSSPKRGYWERHLPWWPSSDNQAVTSFPHHACCMSIHPDGKIVAFGSTKGDVALVPLIPSKNHFHTDHKPTMSKATMFFAIQSLHWMTEHTLIVFHIKGVISMWILFMEPSFSCCSLDLFRVLDMETIGVPISFAFEKGSQLLFVGDTRGSIAMFDVSRHKDIESKNFTPTTTVDGVLNHEKAAGKILKAHNKEHVTAMAVYSMHDNRHIRLISVGFDGYLTESNVLIDSQRTSFQIQKGYSRPISCFSSLSHLLVVKGSIIVAGFQGNTFSCWDATIGFELFSVKSGGRQRRHILFLDEKSVNDKTPLKWSLLALCASTTATRRELQQKKGFSHEIHAYFPSCDGIYHSIGNPSTQVYFETFKNIGIPLHGETINDICWVKTSTPEQNLLLSGSKDGTVNLCLYKNGSFIEPIIKLPSHESAVKAVCCSRYPDRKTSLLVTAGGKLLMNIYRLEELDTAFDGSLPYSLHFLCCHKPNLKAAIDHRFNAVKSIPFDEQCGDNPLHLVFAGDSNGCLHIFVVDECTYCQTISSTLVCTNGRPILCIDVIHSSSNGVFVFTGNSAGEVNIWYITYNDLVGNGPKSHLEVQNLSFVSFAAELLCTYQAHQMGTNDLSALLRVLNDKTVITVCSGGDDQALVACTLEVTPADSMIESSSRKMVVLSIVKDYQNESCLRAVKIRASRCRIFLYAVGYDQRLTTWTYSEMLPNSKTGFLERISQFSLNVFDVASMDFIENDDSYKSTSLVFAVSGEGVETVSVNVAVFEASLALLKANYLLLLAGAGLSADSGLETYECMPELYREFCEPFALMQNEDAFQKFWLQSAKKYENTMPHEGYHILEKWCHGSLPGLATHSSASSPNMDILSPWWVFTSNVDGHFLRFESFRQRTCQIHGNCNEFRCSSGIGLENGADRQGSIWTQWNWRAKSKWTKKCANEVVFVVSESNLNLNHLQCIHCGLPLRPNILMFHDTDENVLRSIRDQCQRYQAWEKKMEDDVVLNSRNLVILELGCGLNVPIVRQESEEVHRDCLNRIRSRNLEINKAGHTAEVTLIRVNPKDAGIDNMDRVLRDHSLSIYDTSFNALRQINQCLKTMEQLTMYPCRTISHSST